VILQRVHLGDNVTHHRDTSRRGVVVKVFSDRIDGWVYVQWRGEELCAHSQAELRTTAAPDRPEAEETR
jgi:hypothetical protein